MTRRAPAAVSPPAHTVRATGRPAKQRSPVRTPRATVSCPLQTFASPPVLRPSRTGARGGAIIGALSVDSRGMHHQPQRPAADSQPRLRQQVVVAEVTRRHQRRLDRGQRRTRPRTPPTGRSRRRSCQARRCARTWRTRSDEVDSRQPRSAPEATKPQVSTVMRNQHHRERGLGSAREARRLVQIGRIAKALHSAAIRRGGKTSGRGATARRPPSWGRVPRGCRPSPDSPHLPARCSAAW
jgi:hypothetical protein